MDQDEAERLIRAAREVVPRDRTLIVGAGEESTRVTIAAVRRAAAAGADVVLVRTPSYFKSQMTTEVFVRHFTAVADASPVPVLPYNVPGLTGVKMAAEAVARLASHPNIPGVKDSSGDLAQIADLVALTPRGFDVLVGSAPTLYASLCVGAVGGIVAVACVVPDLSWRAVRPGQAAGRHDEALALQRRITPLARSVTADLRRRRAESGARPGRLRGRRARLPLRRPAPQVVDTSVRSTRRCGPEPRVWPIRTQKRGAGMIPLPSSERILLGPGPSMTSPRVMRAMAAPVLGHLDPDLLAMMDEVRDHLVRVFRAPAGTLALGVSGTGIVGARDGRRQPGGRRHPRAGGGHRVLRRPARLGLPAVRRACDAPGGGVGACRRSAGGGRRARREGADVVAVVHAETSTGVLNPVEQVAAIARQHGALTIVDAVTSLGAHPVEVERWGVDACYSCAQKGLGAPSGIAPVAFTPRALERKVACRSFAFDLRLLEDYWVRRKYHHTICASLVYALREALLAVEEEGLEARWARHERHHLALAAGLAAMGLDLLPPKGERLWTLNAIRVPESVSDAKVRAQLLAEFNMEIGAGLGPLAGRIFRVGLMGSGSTPQLLLLFLAAFEKVLADNGYRAPAGAGTAAALEALRGRA